MNGYKMEFRHMDTLPLPDPHMPCVFEHLASTPVGVLIIATLFQYIDLFSQFWYMMLLRPCAHVVAAQ
jgi:hypothetical protein